MFFEISVSGLSIMESWVLSTHLKLWQHKTMPSLLPWICLIMQTGNSMQAPALALHLRQMVSFLKYWWEEGSFGDRKKAISVQCGTRDLKNGFELTINI